MLFRSVKFDDKEPGSQIPEQSENNAGSEESDDYSEPDQTSETHDTSEAVTAPDVPIVEASEENQDESQQVIQSKIHSNTSLLILRIRSLVAKKAPEELDHISDLKSLPWVCYP